MPEFTSKSEYEVLYKALTKRQREFVANLEKGMSGTQAALAAGYGGRKSSVESAAVAASRLIKNDKIAAYRRMRANIEFESLGISRDTLTIEMHKIFRKAVEGEKPDGYLALKALSELGKMLGLVDDNKNTSSCALEEYLKKRSEEGSGVSY